MPTWTKEQEAAIYQSGTNIIVSAGAGSGKTAVLTERVIQKIISGVHINELLILTFTKAAAGEMRERIRDALKENKLFAELNLIDSAYITTFDSYALSIVKKYHYLLNISSNINIADASLVMMEKKRIMDQVFDEYYAKEDLLFQKLIGDFCLRDDQNIKKALLTMTAKLEMLPDVMVYLDDYLINHYSDDYLQNKIDTYEQLVLKKLDELRENADLLRGTVDSEYYTKVLENLNGILNVRHFDELSLYHDLKLPSLPRGSSLEAKQIKTSLSNLISDIARLTAKNKKQLLADLQKNKDYVTIIVSIIKDYLKQVGDYKQEHEMYEFNDIALMSIKVLEEHPEACEEIKSSLKEILVDEYQDTNDLQEKFISLIAQDNVYMVGDVKQSIYRFRNANPYIFKNKYDCYALGKGGKKIDLVKNFRSRDVVLQNINEIFDLVMDDTLGGAEYHDAHRMVFGNQTYIVEGKTDQDYNLEILEYNLDQVKEFSKEEIEIFSIANDIKKKVKEKYQVFDKSSKKLKDISYGDFVILMDRTTNFSLYKKIFEYLGIPLTLYMDETLNNSDDIYIIKNLITLIIKINTKIHDTLFKYCFVSVARSFLFHYCDDEIFDYFRNNNFEDAPLYRLFDNINIQTITPLQLLELIIDKTNFYEKILSVGDINNSLIRIQKLMEIAINLGNYGYDVITFSDYLNSLVEEGYEIKYSVGTDNNDSVKIMTIHKSKGLEYHICYFSGLYKQFNISDLKDYFLYSSKYGFIVPYFEEGINQTIDKELVKDDYLKEEISEKIRLFYVALTRAKEKMIMLLPVVDEKDVSKEDNGVIDNNVRIQYRSFADIMNSLKKYLNRYYHELDIATLGLTKDYLYPKKKKLSIDLKKNKFQVTELTDQSVLLKENSFSKKNDRLISKDELLNMRLGTKLHAFLEYTDFKNYQTTGDSFLDHKIKHFLDQDIMKNIQEAKIYKELEFIYNDQQNTYHGIIDLMLEYENYIDIIDYKLKNVQSDAYIKQLKGYKEYVSTKSTKPIHLYLYSLIDDEIKEII